ncbi:MAG: DNA glycosylase [Candidatus Methanomethylophilaceae archaeon]
MKLRMNVSLDPTLGCGQAHRWIKKNGAWEGVLGKEIITLRQTCDGFECTGTSDEDGILEYFRADDDLDAIYGDISASDPYIAELVDGCPGLRILKQDPWECIATYLLATNANVKRIGMMVEAVCREFGEDLGGRFSFPTPKDVIDGTGDICACRLGYRENRFLELAQRVYDGNIVPNALCGMNYDDCRRTLLSVNGIGNKVADCIALFAYGHMEAFPIDARIERVLKEKYHVTGSYAHLTEFARTKFGRYPGYAQEFLYHSDFILESQAQAGGLHPI